MNKKSVTDYKILDDYFVDKYFRYENETIEGPKNK